MPSIIDDEPQGQWNDSNRAFLQNLMGKGRMSFKEGQIILAEIFDVDAGREVGTTEPNEVTIQDFTSYIQAATKRVSPLGYNIRSMVHQSTKERIWCFVNAASDPVTTLATTNTPEETAYIRRLLDAMFEKYNTPRQEIMGVTSMQALKAARAPSRERQSLNATTVAGETYVAIDKGLTNSQAEKLLALLKKSQWLERSREGWYTLAPRALVELRNWLVTTYNDPDAEEGDWQRIKFCVACKEIVTTGQRCSNLDCNVRLHDVCEKSYWKTRRQKKCVKCETEWDCKYWVGERAITTTAAYNEGRRISKGKQRRSEVVVEEDDDDDEEASLPEHGSDGEA